MHWQSIVRHAAVLVLLTVPLALKADPLVGMWVKEHPAQQPPEEFLLFGPDGQFAQAVLPANRPKLDPARLAEAEERHESGIARMTREELLARFEHVQAAHGTYTVSGNVVSRKHLADLDPNLEGTEEIQEFRIDGGALILSAKGSAPGRKGDARFVHLPPLMTKPHPLIGTWVRFFLMRDSTVQQPPATPEWVFFSPDGYYLNMEIHEGRPKMDKPVSQMSKEELLKRFGAAGVTYGTYTVTGNVSNRKHVIGISPDDSSFEQVRGFRFEGDVVNFRGPNANGTEMSAYFERPKSK